MKFSKLEMDDMIFVLGGSDKHALLPKILYRERYPERRQPEKRAFENLMERIERTGSVSYIKVYRAIHVIRHGRL